MLDADPLPVYDAQRQDSPVFSGRRVKRGLYQAANGQRLNAEVNAPYTSLRTVLPRRLWQHGHGERGCGSSPHTAPCAHEARGVLVIVLPDCTCIIVGDASTSRAWKSPAYRES